MKTANRIALVSGGAGGIGAEISKALAARGMSVVVADLNEKPAQDIARALPGDGHLGVALDIADADAVTALFGTLERSVGLVSILVNAAAISPVAADGDRLGLLETTPELWQRVFAVNTFGTYALCRAFLRHVQGKAVEHGRIVNLASSAAQLGGYRSCSAYVASKAAVLGFTKALAREMAPLGITVNAVAPGLIETPMLRAGLKQEDSARAAATVPLQRIGTPGEVAAAVAYLVSPDAAYVTGTTLDVNGGYYMV